MCECNYLLTIYVDCNDDYGKLLYNKTNQMHQFPKFTPA